MTMPEIIIAIAIAVKQNIAPAYVVLVMLGLANLAVGTWVLLLLKWEDK